MLLFRMAFFLLVVLDLVLDVFSGLLGSARIIVCRSESTRFAVARALISFIMHPLLFCVITLAGTSAILPSEWMIGLVFPLALWIIINRLPYRAEYHRSQSGLHLFVATSLSGQRAFVVNHGMRRNLIWNL
jgi:protein-S-isoprenylcysteine O-methyltransferase Ste14